MEWWRNSIPPAMPSICRPTHPILPPGAAFRPGTVLFPRQTPPPFRSGADPSAPGAPQDGAGAEFPPGAVAPFGAGASMRRPGAEFRRAGASMNRPGAALRHSGAPPFSSDDAPGSASAAPAAGNGDPGARSASILLAWLSCRAGVQGEGVRVCCTTRLRPQRSGEWSDDTHALHAPHPQPKPPHSGVCGLPT